ncbi:P60-like protein [Testicularia cyperi]|uniref:Ribosome biogenesis protein NOP53 n=1 Tax=Testicularia cyperi TaxID=1882483 RepID=A0A317Y066_9BASI|nr:P60-like protein [Testicularia cyperi]
MHQAHQKGDVGQPAQPSQSSRKGKKAWRKNIDLSSTEAFLEEQRDPLQQTSSDALFVDDRTGQETLLARQARTKKPLKSLEILQQAKAFGHPALAPAKTQKASKDANKANWIEKKLEDKLRRIAGRQKPGTVVEGDQRGAGERSDEVVKKTLGGVYDVWGAPSATSSPSSSAKGKAKATSSTDNDTAADEWMSPLVAKPTVQPPKTFRDDGFSNLTRQVPAVDLPHPGASYNPDLESHEALIMEAYEIEKRLEDQEQMDRTERDAWKQRLEDIVAREEALRAEKDDEIKRYRGMDIDVPGSEDDGEDDDEGGDEEGGSDVDEDDGSKSEPKRKTRQQRARARRAKMQQVEAQRRKYMRMQAAAIRGLPAEKRREAKLAAAREQAAEARRLQKEAVLASKGLSGQKVGRHTVPESKVDVQVGDELSESLRTLSQEGNLFRDRFVKMQARALVEPRSKKAPKARKFKLKQFETHDYKRFT